MNAERELLNQLTRSPSCFLHAHSTHLSLCLASSSPPWPPCWLVPTVSVREAELGADGGRAARRRPGQEKKKQRAAADQKTGPSSRHALEGRGECPATVTEGATDAWCKRLGGRPGGAGFYFGRAERALPARCRSMALSRSHHKKKKSATAHSTPSLLYCSLDPAPPPRPASGTGRRRRTVARTHTPSFILSRTYPSLAMIPIISSQPMPSRP